jgi:hypothetical protein
MTLFCAYQKEIMNDSNSHQNAETLFVRNGKLFVVTIRFSIKIKLKNGAQSLV